MSRHLTSNPEPKGEQIQIIGKPNRLAVYLIKSNSKLFGENILSFLLVYMLPIAFYFRLLQVYLNLVNFHKIGNELFSEGMWEMCCGPWRTGGLD